MKNGDSSKSTGKYQRYSAGSYHESDVTILGFADGHVIVTNPSIDAGSSEATRSVVDKAKSSFGVWGAMGTMAQNDEVSE